MRPSFVKYTPRTSPDLRRVKALPRRARPSAARLEAMRELMHERYRKPLGPCQCAEILRRHREPPRPCITVLRETQAWALFELGIKRGLLGFIGVGHGKTLLDFIAALAVRVRQALLLVPAPLLKQLELEYELTEQHFRVPSLIIHSANDYTSIQDEGVTLHAMSYAQLSRESSTTLLEENLRPELIIGDEVDKLRHATSVRTGRVIRYFAKHPETKFAGWSGSVTDKSIKDYFHLSAMALGLGSPLPVNAQVADEWAGAIDPADDQAHPGALAILKTSPLEPMESAFHRRLVETEGIVTTQAAAVDVALEIQERSMPDIPPVIREHLNVLRRDWVRPDGEELVDGLAVARCARELAAGFYYYWFFLDNPTRKQVKTWFDARKAWCKELRAKVAEGRPFMDSPLLCTRAARRYWGDEERVEGLPVWKSEHWEHWRDTKDTIRYETRTQRVDDFLARDAAQWALNNRGIVWYDSAAFGEWVQELSGLQRFGGGPAAAAEITKVDGKQSIIASMPSHGRGRNGLQFLFSDQLITQPPTSSTAWEQVLGRLHRTGQLAEIVRAWFYRHTPEVRAHVDEAIARATYVEETIGSAQKLRVGWNSAAA